MTESEIRDSYLGLFSKNWRDPTVADDLRPLREEAERNGWVTWQEIIDARIARSENRFDDAARILEDVLQREPENPHALFLSAAVLSETFEQLSVAIGMYDQLIERMHTSDDLASRQIAAMAMLNKGNALSRLGQHDRAIATYDEVVTRFGEAAELALREQVASAMVNKGNALSRLGQHDRAIAAYHEVVTRFGEADELALREQVAKAMVNKAMALGLLKQLDDAISSLDEVSARFGDPKEPTLREVVAVASHVRSTLLSKLGRPEAADARREAVERAKEEYSEELRVYLRCVLARFDEKTLNDYFAMMEESGRRTEVFLAEESQFAPGASFLLVLREWNSYTPALPVEGEADRGGGYYLRHCGQGVVIDPGYDFLENFARAGGRLCDIDHIVVTHAHDDHTAELESLLMLLHRYNTGGDQTKRVGLYLSQGCQRKFSGIVPLRDAKQIERVVTLGRPGPGCSQRVGLAEGIDLTVLPAYHDDVITRDTAVGLGFELAVGEGETRRLVFTGDTGYYPPRLDAQGIPEYYDREKRRPKVDTAEDKGLFRQYPKHFQKPDLLVAHIGSIVKREFEPVELIRETRREEGEWYYANHLGMLGTLRLLDEMQPKVAVVSEFGAELRGFHIELVAGIAQALHDKQGEDGLPETVVVPGDVTLVYYIDTGQFLCHEGSHRADPGDVSCHRLHTWSVKATGGARAPDVARNQSETRCHLCLAAELDEVDERKIRCYYEDLVERELPHFKAP